MSKQVLEMHILFHIFFLENNWESLHTMQSIISFFINKKKQNISNNSACEAVKELFENALQSQHELIH